MYKKMVKLVSGGIESEREVTYYNMEDLTEYNCQSIFKDYHSQIDLGECPICGYSAVTVNQRQYDGCYAWCPVCGFEGPKHWNPYWAAKMFYDKSFITVAKAQKFDPKMVKENLTIEKFSQRTIDEVRKFVGEEES